MEILITGGSRGIGRACVEAFARDRHSVTFFYKESDDVANDVAKVTGATAVKCDISSSEAVNRAIEGIPRIDVLINNAGVCSFGLFDTVTDSEWDRVLNTNLTGAFYVTRAVSRSMIASKFGRIINIGSVWGKAGASCEAVYSASKAGLRGMTLALAKELGPSGITVNCIEPGVIDTEMNAHLSREELDSLCCDTPLGRMGRADEVAALALFLASEQASFITGQMIGIDGGFAL